VFCELSHRLRTNLRSVAASHHVGYPMLHHYGKLGSFVSLAICRYRLSRVFKSVTLKTHRDGLVARKVLACFVEKRGRRTSLPTEKPVNCVRTQIALMPFIAEQHCAMAPSQNERGTQSGGAAADNEHVEVH
jgi:hypothetical protein